MKLLTQNLYPKSVFLFVFSFFLSFFNQNNWSKTGLPCKSEAPTQAHEKSCSWAVRVLCKKKWKETVFIILFSGDWCCQCPVEDLVSSFETLNFLQVIQSNLVSFFLSFFFCSVNLNLCVTSKSRILPLFQVDFQFNFELSILLRSFRRTALGKG